MPDQIKILITDDHPMTLTGLSSCIEKQKDMRVVGLAESGEEALRILSQNNPDIVILDYSLPGCNGIKTINDLRKIKPKLKVIMFSMHTDPLFMAECVLCGANGYLSKSASEKEIVNTIRVVNEKGSYFGEVLLSAVEKAKKFKDGRKTKVSLTEKEIEIVKLICEGNRNKEIADKLERSIQTVDFHRRNIAIKTGCKNAAQLAIFAKEYGIII